MIDHSVIWRGCAAPVPARARRRRAQGMVEYIMIVALIAILMVAAVVNFQQAINDAFSKGEQMLKSNVTEKM